MQTKLSFSSAGAIAGATHSSPSGVPRPHVVVDDGQQRVADKNGDMKTIEDPYAFPTLLSEFDLYLIGEGTHYRIYDKLGAHIRTIDGVSGVNFGVWAPNAATVSVVGDFNGWDERPHQMRKHYANGVWELFLPRVGEGELYKYRIKTNNGRTLEKADPYACAAEVPPRTASIVADLEGHQWGDDDWITTRRKGNFLEEPISVYEVHLGSWRRDGGQWIGYRELAHRLVEYCREMGFTHLELLPVSEHPFYGSWGYQPIGYYSVTGRYGPVEDFMYFVDHCHQNGIGVILDWVPAHFPRDGHGLRRFDGTALYEHEDPRRGEHPDWGTMVFNYGRNEVRNYLIANALFWLDKYHIDGLRVDAVASMLYWDYSRKEGEWVPNEFGGRENLEAVSMLQEFNRVAHLQFPGVLTIAEESTAWAGVSQPTDAGGLGFSMKWNMGWMNDTLAYMRNEPIHRKHHQNELTFSIIYAFSENFVLALSHDEVVHEKGSLIGQMPGDLWQKFANLRLLYSYMWTHPGKKLLFMGGEFGQWNEWDHDGQLQWELLQWKSHEGLRRVLGDLNGVYRGQPALHELDFDEPGFEWIDCDNHEDSTICYLRRAKRADDFLVVCLNLTPVVRTNYPVGVPIDGWYEEIFNSDSEHYGGSNVGNHPGVFAQQPGWHGRPYSLRITLPPLAAVLFKPQRSS